MKPEKILDAPWKKLDIKRQVLWWLSVLGEGEIEGDSSRILGFLLGGYKCSGTRYRGWLHNTMNVLSAMNLYTSEWLHSVWIFHYVYFTAVKKITYPGCPLRGALFSAFHGPSVGQTQGSTHWTCHFLIFMACLQGQRPWSQFTGQEAETELVTFLSSGHRASTR